MTTTKISLLLAIFAVASCTKSSKINEEQDSSRPTEATPSTQKISHNTNPRTNTQSSQQNNTVSNPPSESSHGETENITTASNKDSTPEPEMSYASAGNLKFNAVLFTNMEHKRHATDSGTYVILRDSEGKLIGVGPITYSAARNGKNVGGMGYPVTQLNVDLQKISLDAKSGNGDLSICKVINTQSYKCKKQSEDTERPVNWYSKPVKYRVTNKEITINNQAGMIGNGPGVAGGLSFAHPVAFVAVGAKAKQYADFSSPIILDLNHNNKLDLIDVKDRNNAVYFDHNGDGQKRLSGWVEKEDGILALDINGDGQITTGVELFGEYSYKERLKNRKSKKLKNFNNGFQALAQYDDNHDKVIDKKDSIYRLLKVWRDLNRNGIGEKNELYSLVSQKVKSIDLNYKKNLIGKTQFFVKSNGNEIRLLGSYTGTSGKKHRLADVWFKEDYQHVLGSK